MTRDFFIEYCIESDMRLDLLHEIGFRLGTHQFVHHLAALDKKDRGDRGDTIVHGNLGIMVNIQFTHVHFTVIFFTQFLDHGPDRAAGTTPFRPEIDYGQLFG